MENNFKSLIDSASSILILLPDKPYFDQVAAGVALYLSIHDQKEVSISSPAPMMVGFNRIIGVQKIAREIGNKNMIIKLNGYDAQNIDKVSYDIENGEFRLTVAPKVGTPPPQKENLEVSHAGSNFDLVILVGGVDDSSFPLLETPDLANAKLVHIGTRVLALRREVLSFAKAGSSVSELTANLIKENGMSMDADVATDLVMGIEEGSSQFGSNEVTPETFETFAFLLRNGGQRMPKIKLSPMAFPPGSIPTQPFGMPKMPKFVPQEEDVQDFEGTQESEQDINPPDDWLQPKVFKGSVNTPDSFSENKG